MKFGQKLHLGCRMTVFQVHQNLPRTGKIARGTLSSHLNTGFCWKLITIFISGGERRCIKHINICARLGDFWGAIEVRKSTGRIIYLFILRILLKFDNKLQLRRRTNVYKAHQNRRPDVWLMGWNPVAKNPSGNYLLIYIRFWWHLITRFILVARSGMRAYAGAARRRVHLATVLPRPPSGHRPGRRQALPTYSNGILTPLVGPHLWSEHFYLSQQWSQ